MSTFDFKVFNVVSRKDKDDFWNSLCGAFKFKTDDGRDGISVPSLNIVLIQPKVEPDQPEA